MPASAAPVHVIINATAGGGCPPDRVEDVRRKFQERGLRAETMCTQSGEQIQSAAARAVAEGAPVVVAAGGDGTVSAVASQLAGTGTALGVLPLGTLNHFARDLRIPLEMDAAIEVIAQGHFSRVDAAEVNGRLFINNSSLGLYPDIVLDRERQRSRLGRGRWAALVAACVHAAKRYPVLSLRLDLNGQTLVRRSAFVFVGNNDYRMQGFEIGERGNLSGGRLSLYVTQRTGRFGLLRLAVRALFRRLRQARDFDMLNARSLRVSTPHKELRVATDGEVSLMKTPLEFRTRPGALRVIVPAGEPALGE